MKETARLRNNSFLNEIITACQYLCIAAVQRPFLCEPGMVTIVKCLLQNLKELGRKNVRTEVVDSKIMEKSLGMS